MSCSRLFVRYELPSSIKNKHLTVPSKQLKRAQSPRCSTARPMGVSQFPEHSTGRLFESRAITRTRGNQLPRDFTACPCTGFGYRGTPGDGILPRWDSTGLYIAGSGHRGTPRDGIQPRRDSAPNLLQTSPRTLQFCTYIVPRLQCHRSLLNAFITQKRFGKQHEANVQQNGTRNLTCARACEQTLS